MSSAPLRIVLLGTTGYHPNDRRETLCLAMPELGLVFDAGTAMYRLRRHLMTPELDIFLTHAHLDHIIGLTFLFDVLLDKSVERVTVHGEAEKLAAIEQHLLSPLLFPVALPCHYQPLAPTTELRSTESHSIEVAGGGRLTYFPVTHPGGAIGYRVDWPGRSLAYVTDTTASLEAPYLEHIRGVDLLIHECYFPDRLYDMAVLTGHSCVTGVAEVAAAAGVGRLVLVHMNPLDESDDPVGLATAQAIFPQTELGYDGMELLF